MRYTPESMLHRPILACLLVHAVTLFAAGTTVRFDPRSAAIGPFPTDFLTVEDAAQETGLRVNLPLPDCRTQPSACQEISLVNTLSGFPMQARLRVRFSGPVDPDTVKLGVFLVALDNLSNAENGLMRTGEVSTVDQVFYDPASNTAYARPDSFLDQHRRYGLMVTSAVRDAAGDPVEADPGYTACLAGPANPYCARLARLVSEHGPNFAPNRIVASSVFTTMAATGWLEGQRARVQDSAPNFRRTGTRSVFAVSDLASLTIRPQVRTDGTLAAAPLPLELFQGVGRIAFGSYRSPMGINEGAAILGLPADAEIFFHVFLPATPMPRGGYPVLIFGHGLTDSRFGAPSTVAAVMAQAGYATIAINAFGHGYGPDGKVVLTEKNGTVTELPTGGRGIDIDRNGGIGDLEGCVLPSLLGTRDCLRQTVIDLSQLVHTIRLGIDVDGDGVGDLNAGLISYAGQSLGAIYGTIFSAVEPGVGPTVLNVGGGSVVEISRLSAAVRPVAVFALATRTPSLLNKGADFDDNYVLRYRPAKVNNVAGAVEIQDYFELADWYQTSGDALAYATHLGYASPLRGVSAKPVLFQFAKGDRTVPNPQNTNLIRAANMRSNARYYRHDLARAAVPALPANPHAFLANLTSPAGAAIAIAAQSQMALFCASGGQVIQDVNEFLRAIFGQTLFEAPGFLTEDLNF